MAGYNNTFSGATTIALGFTVAGDTRFADIDGDGRDEIISVAPAGTLAYRNVNGLAGYNNTYSGATTIALGFTAP